MSLSAVSVKDESGCPVLFIHTNRHCNLVWRHRDLSLGENKCSPTEAATASIDEDASGTLSPLYIVSHIP